MVNIVSFLPSATEMVYALELQDQLVGRTHECNYPPGVEEVPVVVEPALDLEGLDPGVIDEAVEERMENAGSLYLIDEERLRALEPDLILTQDLCDVCAPSGQEASRVLETLDPSPQILWMSPGSIGGIFENIQELGRAAGVPDRAEDWVRDARERLRAVDDRVKGVGPVREVFCMEWFDPIYCAGHWVPEQVEYAGGVDRLGQPGGDSRTVAWERVREYDPEVLVLMPCGLSTEEALEEVPVLGNYPDWDRMDAVVSEQVFAVDAESYFARPGPRVVEGTRLMAHLLHPGRVDWEGPEDAYRRVRG